MLTYWRWLCMSHSGRLNYVENGRESSRFCVALWEYERIALYLQMVSVGLNEQQTGGATR